MNRSTLATILMLLACSCGRKNKETARPPTHAQAVETNPAKEAARRTSGVPADFDQWPREKRERFFRIKAEFDAKIAETSEKTRALEEAFDAEVKAADEKEMIRSSPPGFAPRPLGPRLKLTLIPRETTLKPGDELWYRAELQNLSSDTFKLDVGRSFWKQGNGEFDKFHFFITPPGGKEFDAFLQVPEADVIGSGARVRMNAAQRRDSAFRSERRNGLHVDLKPGETLVSRAWRYLNDTEIRRIYYEDWEPPRVPGEFRELALEDAETFSKPGIYRIRAVFQDWVPKPPTEEVIQEDMKNMGYSHDKAKEIAIRNYNSLLRMSLGHIESNTATIEVKP